MRSDDLLPIGEVAARSGVAPSALRFYESLGLIQAQRTSGGTACILGISFAASHSSGSPSA